MIAFLSDPVRLVHESRFWAGLAFCALGGVLTYYVPTRSIGASLSCAGGALLGLAYD